MGHAPVGDSGRQCQRHKCPACILGHSRPLGRRLSRIFDVPIGHPRGATEPEVRREQRISDLRNISRNVDLYWETNQKLPESFEDMSGQRYSIFSIHDPESNEEYEYRVIEEAGYELCAVFSADSARSIDPDRPYSAGAWDHGTGRTCFQLEAQSQQPPPPPAPSTGEG